MGQFISPARPDHGAPRDAFTINNNNLSGSTTGCFKAKAFVYLIPGSPCRLCNQRCSHKRCSRLSGQSLSNKPTGLRLMQSLKVQSLRSFNKPEGFAGVQSFKGATGFSASSINLQVSILVVGLKPMIIVLVRAGAL